MASRYPSTKVLDYCYHPVRLVNNCQVQYVPCGKCDGCLLHKANEWSMRLGCEIEDNVLAIFYTLTYSNKYLPTFRYVGRTYSLAADGDESFSYCDVDCKSGKKRSKGFKVFSCHHYQNIRFNGVEDVLRNEEFDKFVFGPDFTGVPATNYVCDQEYFAYSSKRDFQLFLKLIRKDLYELNKEGRFSEVKSPDQLHFRYFCISEYGAEKLRPHLHSVILPNDPEVAEYLCYEGLYKSWQMCDRGMFQQYTHFADSGCRGYITQYLTCNSLLPSVYQKSRIKPWRLASKGKAIGFNGFDEAKILEDVSVGVTEYNKTISRLDERYILRYPKALGSRIFPKCFEYSRKDFQRLYRIYSVLWCLRRDPRWKDSKVCFDRLSEIVNPADVQAAKTCFKYCDLMSWHPHTYVYCLDMFWYKQSMSALKVWYEWQSYQTDPYEIIRSYDNFSEYRQKAQACLLSSYSSRVLILFLRGLSLDWNDLFWNDSETFSRKVDNDYSREVSDILADMVKMPKFNERFGFSPNSDSNF